MYPSLKQNIDLTCWAFSTLFYHLKGDSDVDFTREMLEQFSYTDTSFKQLLVVLTIYIITQL